MMVSPELISASNAPSANPLNTCEMKLGQLTMRGNHTALRKGGPWHCPFEKKWRRRLHEPPRRPGSCSALGRLAEMAAERIRLLHQALARDDFDHVVVIFLALHVFLHLALDDDDGADALVVFGAVMHLADGGG